jgi:chromosomal replication initiation ATPase DnaA
MNLRRHTELSQLEASAARSAINDPAVYEAATKDGTSKEPASARRLSRAARTKTVYMADCRGAVQTRLQISAAEILGTSTRKRVSEPRQIAMALARELTGASLPKIGLHFGRDHTTVLHALRRVAAAEAKSSAFKVEIDELRLTLNVYAAQTQQFLWGTAEISGVVHDT